MGKENLQVEEIVMEVQQEVIEVAIIPKGKVSPEEMPQ